MDFITDGSKRMQNLVTDLLDYSRVHSENAGLENFEAQEQIETAMKALEGPVKDSNAVITCDDMPVIFANPVRFCRLMQNLIGNAIKYRSNDRNPVIHVGIKDQGEKWLFSVSDNGIGIKEEHLKQVFVIFRRLHNKNEYAGTGIGLAICKKIVESFSGELWVESVYNKGSTFYFTIPKIHKKKVQDG